MQHLIRFTSKTGTPLYVASVSFKDGDGYRVKSVKLTKDAGQAARFRPEVADAIATHYFTNPVCTLLADGTLVKDYTAEHLQKTAVHYAAQRQIRQDFNDTLTEALLARGINLNDLLRRTK
jgi:hypothetical protein